MVSTPLCAINFQESKIGGKNRLPARKSYLGAGTGDTQNIIWRAGKAKDRYDISSVYNSTENKFLALRIKINYLKQNAV